MRLAPVDRPPTLKARVAAWMMKRQLGKVITPARVIYDRVPRMYDVAYALVKLQQRGMALDPTTRFLVTSWVAMQNHCSFCVDIARAAALMERVDLDKLNALPEWRSSSLFDERERAALAFADEANRSLAVSDETFERARQHFSEREVTEIVILGAVENFYNRLNIPLEIEEDGLCAIQQRRRAHA
ncbi:MAG: carboxymuconolactone decarboxylase family protein [Deltaproteobacteria bacterium]|nr:carboxymuconolactone decarboxylase family protein [Deltaproteobacteria bacterium]